MWLYQLRPSRVVAVLFVGATLFAPSPLWSIEDEETIDFPADLTEMSLEELMDIEVTSVSKKAQKASAAAAAIYVITHEDIRRSGATSLADMLRMVPGLQVARADANTWAVASRGFAGQYANKLLVLIDGRSVYTPLFSGVFWSHQDTLLADIERIEVIRGPGASVWGANAVNGVINIITRHARDSQGGYVSGGYGNEEEGFGAMRYGFELDDNAWFRAYAKYTDRDDSVFRRGGQANDKWDTLQGGFRLDWDLTEIDSLTFQGDTYRQNSGNTDDLAFVTPPYSRSINHDSETRGSNLLTRLTHDFSESSILSLQLYYDRVDSNLFDLNQLHDIIDVELKHQFKLDDCQDIVWGVGYRAMRETVDSNNFVTMRDESRCDGLVSGFIQDEITVIDELLRLTVGSKFEHNDYTGYEVQPTVRILLHPHDDHTVWAALSRAVRTPSTVEDSAQISAQTVPPNPPFQPFPIYSFFQGDEDFESERLTAFEVGYRVQPLENLSLDLATFLNVYDNLRTLEIGTPIFTALPAPHLSLPVTVDNSMKGKTYGAELAADWWMADWWRFRSAYTFLQMELNLDNNSTDNVSEANEKASPHHQFSVRSYIDLMENLELDVGYRYVDRLPQGDVGNYSGVDMRLGWRPIDDMEIALVGQNLFRRRHFEFTPDFNWIAPSEVERSVYAQISWRF